jgi:cation diffusion facilitator CzcD-associated flavoprotein CzcO
MAFKLVQDRSDSDDYPLSYYQASQNRSIELTPLDGSRRADVCIIGAGYTGLSSALHLAQHGYDVVLLEARKPGWGASGRNGGQLCSGQRKIRMNSPRWSAPIPRASSGNWPKSPRSWRDN